MATNHIHNFIYTVNEDSENPIEIKMQVRFSITMGCPEYYDSYIGSYQPGDNGELEIREIFETKGAIKLPLREELVKEVEAWLEKNNEILWKEGAEDHKAAKAEAEEMRHG